MSNLSKIDNIFAIYSEWRDADSSHVCFYLFTETNSSKQI